MNIRFPTENRHVGFIRYGRGWTLFLLEAGNPAETEKVYREDLEEFPKNGWSLFGLYQSLKAQGKTDAAGNVKAQFDRAWKYADIELTASVIE